jgi:hypothetical protein
LFLSLRPLTGRSKAQRCLEEAVKKLNSTAHRQSRRKILQSRRQSRRQILPLTRRESRRQILQSRRKILQSRRQSRRQILPLTLRESRRLLLQSRRQILQSRRQILPLIRRVQLTAKEQGTSHVPGFKVEEPSFFSPRFSPSRQVRHSVRTTPLRTKLC